MSLYRRLRARYWRPWWYWRAKFWLWEGRIPTRKLMRITRSLYAISLVLVAWNGVAAWAQWSVGKPNWRLSLIPTCGMIAIAFVFRSTIILDEKVREERRKLGLPDDY